VEFARIDEAILLVQFPVPVGADLEELAVALFAVAQRLLDVIALGDVAGDASIPAERPVLGDDRLAAHGRGTQHAARGVAADHDEIAEGLLVGERADVLVPVAVLRLEADLPAALADELPRLERRLVLDAIAKVREAELLVLLPVPIRRQFDHAAEALLALPQRLRSASTSTCLLPLPAAATRREREDRPSRRVAE
jgi:hypothetical protein